MKRGNFFNRNSEHLDEHNPTDQQITEDGRLHSALITREDRKYYLDLKENERGRFLRVCFIECTKSRKSFSSSSAI